jgi:hypothetical protein
MKKMRRGIPASFFQLMIIMIFAVSAMPGCHKPSVEKPRVAVVDMQERIHKIKRATVRIHVDGKPRGTGFVIDEYGLIATAFHVVGKAVPVSKKKAYLSYASSIEVQFHDGDRLPARVHKSCIGQGLYRAAMKDYCILEVGNRKTLDPLRLGNFKDVREGAHVYMCGYPLVAEESRVTFGIISTKWDDIAISYQDPFSPSRKDNVAMALLDIPMKRGDSGGPVVLIGNTPEDDRVICIASFVTTPLDQDLKALVKALKGYEENGRQDSMSAIELFQMMKKALKSESLFISGCVSIDSLTFFLPKKGKNS